MVTATPPPAILLDLPALAKQAEEIGDWQTAAKILQTLSDGARGDIALLLRLAHAAQRAGLHETALAAIDRVLPLVAAEADRVRAQTILAATQIRGGDRDAGNALFEKLLRQNEQVDRISTRRMILLEWGTVAWQSGDLPAARRHFQSLLSVSPPEEAAGVRLNLALVERDAGNRAGEKSAYEAIVGDPATPNSIRANAEIALVHLDLDRLEPKKSMERLRIAATNQADPGQLLTVIRLVMARAEKADSAEKTADLYRQAMALLEKSHAEINALRIDLANWHFAREQTEDAWRLYRLVAQESPVATQVEWAAEMAAEIESRQRVEP